MDAQRERTTGEQAAAARGQQRTTVLSGPNGRTRGDPVSPVAVLDGPVLMMDGAQCAALRGALVEAIRLGYTARGSLPPRVLEEHSNEVAIIARAVEQRRADSSFPQVTPGLGAADLRTVPSKPCSQEPVTLTIGEAARWAGV